MEFDINGNLVFDGKYLNGNRWEGAIIEYDLDDGEIIFEGEFIEGKKVEIMN